jgi:predicted GNAT superfamily acetyltransferase
MKIDYEVIEGLPELSKLREILDLYELIFDSEFVTNGFVYEVEKYKKLLFNLAYIDQTLVGFKIGFEKKYNSYYSWLGGVHMDFRGHGIAKSLMKQQHDWLLSKKFKTITTHNANMFKSMLILNLKNGFDITGTNINSRGEQRLILRKSL